MTKNIAEYCLPTFLLLLLTPAIATAASRSILSPAYSPLPPFVNLSSRHSSTTPITPVTPTTPTTPVTTTLMSQRRGMAAQQQVYVSASGDLLGAYVLASSTRVHVSNNGILSLISRDYTDELTYDYRDRLERIGNAEVSYDFRGRVEQIGSTRIGYGFRDRINQIGSAEVAYTARGKVSQIGDVMLQYDRNLIETISANYTSGGVRIVVVQPRHRL